MKQTIIFVLFQFLLTIQSAPNSETIGSVVGNCFSKIMQNPFKQQEYYCGVNKETKEIIRPHLFHKHIINQVKDCIYVKETPYGVWNYNGQSFYLSNFWDNVKNTPFTKDKLTYQIRANNKGQECVGVAPHKRLSQIKTYSGIRVSLQNVLCRRTQKINRHMNIASQVHSQFKILKAQLKKPMSYD